MTPQDVSHSQLHTGVYKLGNYRCVFTYIYIGPKTTGADHAVNVMLPVSHTLPACTHHGSTQRAFPKSRWRWRWHWHCHSFQSNAVIDCNYYYITTPYFLCRCNSLLLRVKWFFIKQQMPERLKFCIQSPISNCLVRWMTFSICASLRVPKCSWRRQRPKREQKQKTNTKKCAKMIRKRKGWETERCDVTSISLIHTHTHTHTHTQTDSHSFTHIPCPVCPVQCPGFVWIQVGGGWQLCLRGSGRQLQKCHT